MVVCVFLTKFFFVQTKMAAASSPFISLIFLLFLAVAAELKPSPQRDNKQVSGELPFHHYLHSLFTPFILIIIFIHRLHL